MLIDFNLSGNVSGSLLLVGVAVGSYEGILVGTEQRLLFVK